jgi:hypothetical protein
VEGWTTNKSVYVPNIGSAENDYPSFRLVRPAWTSAARVAPNAFFAKGPRRLPPVPLSGNSGLGSGGHGGNVLV